MPPERASVSQPRNLSLVLFTITIWGVAFPIIRVALDEMPPITMAAVRFAIASAFFLSLQFTIGGGRAAIARMDRRQWALVAVFGLFQSGLSNWAQNIGMQWTTSGLASIIQSVGPIFAASMAIVILGERYTHLKALGGGLAIVGTVGIVTGGGADLSGSAFVGNGLMVVTAFAYAMGGLIAKYLLRDMDPITLMTTGTPFAVGALAVGAAFEADPVGSMASASVAAWASVVFLALVATGLTMVLWYRVLERVELSQLSYFVYLIPVVSVLFAWAMLGETINLQQALFAGLLISGVAVAQRDGPQTAAAVVGATVPEGPPDPPSEGGGGAGGPRY